MESEARQHVAFAYNRQCGEARYTAFAHRGVPPRYPPFQMQLPVLFLPWDDDQGGVMCFAHPAHQTVLASDEATQDETALIGVCRCGVVKYAKYFQRGRAGERVYDVALKVMDKKQLALQHDDVSNEVRVMAQLQPAGFAGVYHSPHFSQWECLADAHNEYIAMDWAANGSLIMYAKRRLTDYKRFAVERLVANMTSLPGLEQAVNAFVARAWMLEALYIFHGVLKGLAYMHAQNVCHLDIDPCNVVIDSEHNPRLIDFGSSEIMTNNGRAGADDRLIKFKPLYVAEEVRAHNQHPEPRPGFFGAPADMWSAGVLLYQLLCFGYPKGHLALVCDTNWATNLLAHAHQPGYDSCLKQEGCLICFRKIEFPPLIYELFRGLLLADRPSERLTAVEASNLLQPLLGDYDLDFHRRAQATLPLLSPSPGRRHRHRRASFETGFPLVVAEDEAEKELQSVSEEPPAAASCCHRLSRTCAVPFTLLMSAIGAGTLAVPYTFVLLSPPQATLALLCVGGAMAFTAASLVDVHVAVAMASADELQEPRETYQHLAWRAGGKPLARLAGGLTALAVFGACVGCVRVVSDMAPALLTALLPDFDRRPLAEQQRDVALTVWIVVLAVVLPLGCLAKISALRFSSYLGVAFSVYLVAAVAYRAAFGGGGSMEIPVDAPPLEEDAPSLFWRLSEALGIFNFTFMLHLNVIPLLAQLVAAETSRRRQLQDRELEELGGTDAPVALDLLQCAGQTMRRQLAVAVGVCVLLYAAFGLCAAQIYGSQTQGNILLNLAHDPIMAVPRVAVLLTILLSFPLLFHPLRALVLEMYVACRFRRDVDSDEDGGEKSPPTSPSKGVQAAVTVALLVAQILCARRVPGLQVVFSFVGSSILLALCYLFPLIFYVRLAPWRSSRTAKTRLVVLAVLAVLATVFCVAATLQLVLPA
ncbi:hypothetical protein BBJ28_00021366 [Nothophytophthora sp. Chile5]|nr:hypothetical protein BBJ28_00021366 [Nothophytophthora sp. Chile5]